MTFAILGHCARTGAVGIGITSSTICVGSRCAWVRAGVGAVASQNIADPRLGPTGLDLMELGYSARAACEELSRAREFSEYRQLAAIDQDGNTGHFTGARGLGIHAAAEGDGCVAVGNLLQSKDVVSAMVDGYRAAGDDIILGERLMAGLEAGLAAGAEADAPLRAAGLLVADRYTWPTTDLRVDWHEEPIAELRRIWDMYLPELENFVMRSVNPAEARNEE